jgi:hypothetical protein
MLCVICGKAIEYIDPVTRRKKTTYDPRFLKQTPYCPEPSPCGTTWRNRQPLLFNVSPPEDLPGVKARGGSSLINALQAGMGDYLTDKDFVALTRVSKDVRGFAIPNQLKSAHRQVKHYDKQNQAGVDILADQMLEIAILAYHGALEVKSQGKPIILYRVADKTALTVEEKMQTLSGRIRVKIPTATEEKEVWPLEKTAAWIQGALRARANFLLLSDPRDNLQGGKDGHSDAVYVRELHQILSSHYMIAEAGIDDLTDQMRRKSIRAFILKPKPDMPSAPLPLIPRMSTHMSASNTWDGSVPSLTLSDPSLLVRSSLREQFVTASSRLGGLPLY